MVTVLQNLSGYSIRTSTFPHYRNSFRPNELSECEWTIFNVQILKDRWHVFFLSCVCCWSHQPLEAAGLGLHPFLRAMSLNLSLLEALGVWIARRLSVSVHHRHRQSGHLLIHNKSPVFIARHCYLIQLIEAFYYLLLVPDLKTRVIRECSPVMPDLGTWSGEHETHSYTHGDLTKQNVLYGSAFRMEFLSFFLTMMWSNWESIPVARSWILDLGNCALGSLRPLVKGPQKPSPPPQIVPC